VLYLTTRNRVESVPALYVLSHDRCYDGGYFVPLQIPTIGADDLESMTSLSSGECLARILNLFFSTHLNGWDVDFCIGRHPTRLVPIGQKVYIAESWHNPDRDFASMVKNLSSRIYKNLDHGAPSDWAWISARIAVLFEEYVQLRKNGALVKGQTMDVSVDCLSFDTAMTCWYARRMGLPIRKVICSCLQNSLLWDFLRTGCLQISTSHDADDWNMFFGLERLIYSVLGRQEVDRFLNCIQNKRNYFLNDLNLQRLAEGFGVSVVSSQRLTSVIRGTHSSSGYLMDPHTALAYAGGQDLRSTEGETGIMLLISEKSPIHYLEVLSKMISIPAEELRSRF